MIKIPRYNYQCQNCKVVTEFIHSIKKDHVNKPCPKCGKRKLQRLISKGVSVIFKGDGFWRSTDYINQKSREDGLININKKPGSSNRGKLK